MERRWLSARAVRLHVALVVVVPGCLALGWWQLERALSGNTLSWVYTFEWPFFAAYGIYVWRKLVREIVAEGAPGEAGGGDAPGEAQASWDAGSASGDESHGRDTPGDEETEDEQLAAYNRYLAELNASGRQKRW